MQFHMHLFLGMNMQVQLFYLQYIEDIQPNVYLCRVAAYEYDLKSHTIALSVKLVSLRHLFHPQLGVVYACNLFSICQQCNADQQRHSVVGLAVCSLAFITRNKQISLSVLISVLFHFLSMLCACIHWCFQHIEIYSTCALRKSAMCQI